MKFGLKDYGVGRGSAIFDLENDGDMDLIVVSQKPIMEYGPPSITRLYRNDLKGGNYLQVKLHQLLIQNIRSERSDICCFSLVFVSYY